MEIYERVRVFRKEILKITQQAFADEIKMSRSNLGNIETGEVAVTDRVIYSICEKFNANEDWLRTGNGEPTIKRTRKQEIGAFVNETMNLPDKNIKKRLVEALVKLDERDWETIAKIADSLKGGD